MSEKHRGSILVVDDDTSMLELADAALTAAGYSVLTNANGREALRRLELTAIDLVILDIVMPDQDGIEAMRQIRLQRPDLPVVVMSGYGPDSTYLRAALALGATAALGKPFGVDELIAMVDWLMGRRNDPIAP